MVANMTPMRVIYNCMFRKCILWKDEEEEKDDPVDPTIVNLHVVPHSHTDAGWIEPIDWYYQNWVRHIFDNILHEMYDNPDITFVWADTNYLHQWFESQNEDTKNKFRTVVNRGQLEFVGGGWVQNDESLSDLKSIINQMNFGLQYLHKTFNATPTVGWQIDPFGYNHFMPSVFKELGYKYLVLNRIGDIRKENFKNSSNMDFWLEPADLGADSNRILTHVLPRHYEPLNYDDLIRRIPSEGASTEEKLSFTKYFYESYVKEDLKGYKTEEYMLLMGKDFGFHDSNDVLSKINIMNKIVTEHSKKAIGIQINCKFSLPSKYFSKIENSKKLKNYSIDFLNYDERLVYLHPHEDFSRIDYWVGYYFTRPHLKKRINEAFNSFRSLETLITYVKYRGKFHKELEESYVEIQKQLSYMLHHDAITGTSRQHTIDDYYSRIDKSEYLINQLINEINSILLGGATEVSDQPNKDEVYQQPIYYFNQAVYKRNLIITIPNTYTHVRVKDNVKDQYLECEIIRFENNKNMLYVLIEIEGLTMKTFTLEYSTISDIEHQAKVLEQNVFNETMNEFSTEHYTLKLNKDTLLQSITSKKNGKTMNLDQEFNYYSNTMSGIYVFKPTEDKQTLKYTLKYANVYKGNLVSVVSSKSTDNISQVITVYKKGDTQIAPLIQTTATPWRFAEVGFAFNTTDMSDKKEFYNHDSNEFIRRDFREVNFLNETGKNIYPIIHGYALKDQDTAFGIVNNYPTGCGYIKNDRAQIQCFLTRSTNKDDDKGLPDVLDEGRAVTFSYFLMFNKITEYSKEFIILSDYFNLPLTTKIEKEESFNVAELNQAISCMFPEEKEAHNFDNKDYFYSSPGFSLLRKNDLGIELEVFDLFENHRAESFLRVRNRQTTQLFGTKLSGKDTDINLRDTFVFELEGENKYNMNGLSKQDRATGKFLFKLDF